MNDENKALNEAEEQPVDTTPVSEEIAPEEEVNAPEETESTETVEAEAEITETESVAPKKGLSNRIGELVNERNQYREEAKSLQQRLAELTGSVEPQQQYIPQDTEPIVRPGEEIDAIELDRRIRTREQGILQKADALAQLRTKQAEAINRISNESQSVIRKYPELDPESDSFNKELSDTISEATEAYVSRKPYDASVKDFVDRLMKPYKGAVDKEVGKVAGTIAKQVSESALKPTSVRKEEKSTAEMSLEELEKKLGVVQA